MNSLEQKPEPKKSNWLEKNIRKVITVGAVTIATFASQETHAQQTYTDKDTLVKPTATWHFEDAAEATNQSQKYPGFVENFIKNPTETGRDTGTFVFNGYTDEEGNSIETPESVQIDILKKEAQLSTYANPEAWATQQLEFQKTTAFRDSIDAANIKNIETQIQKQKDIQSVAGNNQKGLEEAQQSLDDYHKNHAMFLEKDITEKTLSYEQLVAQASSFKAGLEEQLSELKAKYNHIEKYIADHSKK